jgi:glycosyltransferase involved in cell wall biosynthesis
MQKILQIGNYPPPMCGWAIQTVLLKKELERRGQVCQVMNINENRRVKGGEFIDVQGGTDYVVKLLRHLFQGYRLNVHVNGGSPKGYVLALIAALFGRLAFRPTVVTFHGGIPQPFFPRNKLSFARLTYKLLFALAGSVTCDSEEIRSAILKYGLSGSKVAAIPCFSSELLETQRVDFDEETERFLSSHAPIFFCYVSFRPEYRLDVLRAAMSKFRALEPRAGFIWLGFPENEMDAVRAYIATWSDQERVALLLLGNLKHDQFVTLLGRCTIKLRTPACDGISASVLESLALGVPVVASDNGRRPPGVVTYNELDVDDLVAKLQYVIHNHAQVKASTLLPEQHRKNNTELMADWVLGTPRATQSSSVARAV